MAVFRPVIWVDFNAKARYYIFHFKEILFSFPRNEYLAVRNAEGGFYVCQAMQNVYRTTRKIKIRWLSQDKSLDPSGETYKPDFYDVTGISYLYIYFARQTDGKNSYLLSDDEPKVTASHCCHDGLNSMAVNTVMLA